VPGLLERILNAVLLGLLPPVPSELRSDYALAPADDQAKHRRRYAVKHLRWSRIVSGVAAVMMIKWAWECGFLAFIGLGAGFAQSGEIDKVRIELQASRADQAAFKALYERTNIENQIRGIDAEAFQLQTAVAQANRENRPPDVLHMQRLSNLKTERENLQRRLDELRRDPTR
jgi:hypothetical protein